jgi:hypothetical protein
MTDFLIRDFWTLINAFISASVLHYYNSQQKLQMKTNISETVYTDILSQQWKNKWHSIIYFSRKFSSSELNYSVYNKKLMIIIMSFRQWKTLSKRCFQDKNLIRSCKSQTVHESNNVEWSSSTLTYIADIIQLYYSILSRHFELSRWIILKIKLYDRTEWEVSWKCWEALWVKSQAISVDVKMC